MLRTALLALAFVSAPALATSSHYLAQPVAAPTKETVVTRDAVWKCAGGACAAPRGNSRAEVACQALVREVGALASFSANGTAFAAEQLDKCNARAR
ncbi:MAG: CC_3452 family protein [Allosphingosinicella sp.]|uniref:CC_3452 family protein n=1 Tax=Allosphingosinicella sp. TaxID=2823234 RepID=UPI00392DACD4